MTADYSQELLPPSYRNLALNPNGEAVTQATWFASNGTVQPGSTDVPPITGTGTVEYTVTAVTSLSYYFSPFGPSETVHRNAFKIPAGRTVSASVQLRSNVDSWVELQARFYVWDGIQLSPISTRSINPTTTVVLDSTDTNGYVDPNDSLVYITGTNTGVVDTADALVFEGSLNAGSVDPLDALVFTIGADTSVYVSSTPDGALSASDPAVFITTGAPTASDPSVFFYDTGEDLSVFTTTSDIGALSSSDPAVFVTTTPVTVDDPSVVFIFSSGGVAPNSYTTTDADGVLIPGDPPVFNFTAAPTALNPPYIDVIDSTVPGQTVVTSSTKLTGGAGWQKSIGFGDTTIVPAGATHWSFLITVAGSDPSGFVVTPPAEGVKIYADQTFVTDSGMSLAGVTYIDGSRPNAYWEGLPNYSSSRTGTAPVVTPPVDPPPNGGGSDDPGGDVPPPTDPDVPPQGPPTPPVIIIREPTTAEVAADIMTWRNTPQNMCLKSDFQIANLRLNSIDSQGVLWILSDIEGWWTLPEPDVPDIPRGWFDGSYETRGRYAARVFTLTGSFIPTHASSVADARGRLTRAINLVHRGDWFITHEDATVARTNTKASKVWLSGQPFINTVNANGRTDFSIGLRAPDPVKYRLKNGLLPGYERLVVSTLSKVDYPGRAYPRRFPSAYPESVFGLSEAIAVNYGDTVVWPTLTLKGPTRGPVNITNADTGQKLRVVRKLNASEELVINCFTKEVTLNGFGNYRFYLDIDVDWLMIQPGANRLYFEEDVFGSQRTELEVLWRSGWIG